MYNRKVSIWEVVLGIVITILVTGATVTFLEFQTSPRGTSFDFGRASDLNKAIFWGSKNRSLVQKRGLADYDQDGLLNWEELQYSTYINDKDSDNDGYSDGREIQDGFNPKGEGKLSPSLQKIKQEIAVAKKEHGSETIPEKYREKVREEMLPEEMDSETTLEPKEEFLPGRGFVENFKTYLYSVSFVGPLFNNLPLPFKGIFLVFLFFSLAFFILKVSFSVFILNKVNGWWGDAPSNDEISLKIVALLLLFDFVYGGIEFFIKLGFLNNKPFSLLLFLIGVVLNIVFFTFLMKKFYQTEYGNGLKIVIASKLLVVIILAIIGVVFSAITMFLFYMVMFLTGDLPFY